MHLKLTALIIFTVFGVFLTQAQVIVHIENKRFAEPDSGWSGNIGLNATFIQNFNDIFISNNSSLIQYRKNQYSLISLNNLNFNVVNKQSFVNDGFQHLRFSTKLNRLFSFETFGQAQFNKLANVDYRYLLGWGFRAKLIQKDSIRLLIGSSFMSERDKESLGKQNSHFRLSQYLSFGLPIANTIYFDLIAYYQPDLNNKLDYRTSVAGMVNIKINKHFSFRINHSLYYDSYPAEGMKRTIYNFTNGLNYTF